MIVVYPPENTEVILIGPFPIGEDGEMAPEALGYWTGEVFMFSADGEDQVADGVTGWRLVEG